MAESTWTFSEREFYLAEFRGRTLGVALAEEPGTPLDALHSVVSELARNGTRCVLLSPSRALLGQAAELLIEPGKTDDWRG